MNLILVVVILKFFIANTVQNLIRFGDFQNIIPPSNQTFMHSASCSTYCDGIWYIPPSVLAIIELEINCPVPGQNHTTTIANMIQNDYIKLCQDFTAVEIERTYQYSFDMNCNAYEIIQSCSIWVILNGQAINGSNHTHTDQLVHNNVGYINITQQNNTICFQSRQQPYIQYSGSSLDNVTLQIYTGNIPCNVIGCKLCVLNFPNVCQVFQPEGLNGSSCKSKFYFNGNICKVCLFPCEACQGQARKCLSCQKLYRLQQNQCVIADEIAAVASAAVSIPGIQFFYIGQIFIGDLDLFWPYYSHHRIYGQQTDEILTFIHTLQNNKWFLLSLEKKIDFNFQSINFSDYSQYSNQQFLKMEGRTSYFWDGAFELLFFSFPTTLIVFFVLNRIFYLTFEYRISKYFRPYSFLFMIYFLGIGEDISYLSFLSFNNGMNLFSFKFQDKLGHIVWIFVFFLLVLFCSAGYFITKIIYKKLSKYFIDGFFPKLQSFHILGCLSMKAFVVGSINALLATNYEALIISLGSAEMVYLIGVIYLQWKNRCYKIQTFMFLQMLKSLIMIIFNVSLWIDWKIRVFQQGQTEQQTKKLLDFNCKVLVIVIIGLGVFEAISIHFSGREVVDFKRKKQVSKSEKCKRQVLKIVKLEQNPYVTQQMEAEKNYFNQAQGIEKAQKQLSLKIRKQEGKKLKIKQPLKANTIGLKIIYQQACQNEYSLEETINKGPNNN